MEQKFQNDPIFSIGDPLPNADKMIMKGADVLPRFNNVETSGQNGEGKIILC